MKPTRGNSSPKWNSTFATARRAVFQLAAAYRKPLYQTTGLWLGTGSAWPTQVPKPLTTAFPSGFVKRPLPSLLVWIAFPARTALAIPPEGCYVSKSGWRVKSPLTERLEASRFLPSQPQQHEDSDCCDHRD